MPVRWEELRLSDFRNFDQAILRPGPALNILSGPNASGKTAVLEAIHLLCRGRSFRTSRVRELIRHGHTRLQALAWLRAPGGRRVALGVERDTTQTRLRYDGNPVRNLSDHARHLPLVLITPDSHDFINGGPQQRRRWLDWALFHVEPDYIACWQACFQALRQRNALLRRQAPASGLASWEETLARQTECLDRLRQRFVTRLSREFDQVVTELLGSGGNLGYLPGRDDSVDYRQLLADGRERDRESGFTRAGPHRSDLVLRFRDRQARSILSRGQAKLFIAGIMLAWARLLGQDGDHPLLLVDDLPAELDEAARQRFLRILAETGAQTFVTAIDPGLLSLEHWPAVTRFHVEQECRTEVVQ